MKREKQPAKVSYFFGPGWKNLGEFTKIFWNLNRDDVRKRQKKFESGMGVMSIRGVANLISCFMLILFGTAFFVIISGAVSVILGIAYIIVYILFFIVWLTDRIYLLRKRIFVACPNCKEKYLIPTYRCPNCNRKHTRLTPGKYGAFYRTCECGEKIPCHFLTKRGSLAAECPNCGYSLSGTETVPICVPVIGGRSAGKTAYITAFVYEFIEKVAPRNGLRIRHYNQKMTTFYNQEIKEDYLHGTTRMTKTENDISQASTKAFNFMVGSDKFSPERLVQIYDVAGESFIDNTENEEQLQYKYCQGIVFMIDPLAIPMARNHMDEKISEVDKNSVGTMDMDIILDAFMNKLRQITGKSVDKVISTPIAIVISKGDIKTLSSFIGEEVISDYMIKHELSMDSYMDVQDKIIRQFLNDNGMAGFVNNIDLKFKNNRYFICSAIGHTREAGHYNPKGVLEPMEWIFHKADPAMKNAWNEHKFGNN